MKTSIAGGSLLHTNVVWENKLAPLIIPGSSNSNNNNRRDGETFVLLPQRNRIDVVSFRTGVTIKQIDVARSCIASAVVQKESLFVGLENGDILEYCALDGFTKCLTHSTASNSTVAHIMPAKNKDNSLYAVLAKVERGCWNCRVVRLNLQAAEATNVHIDELYKFSSIGGQPFALHAVDNGVLLSGPSTLMLFVNGATFDFRKRYLYNFLTACTVLSSGDIVYGDSTGAVYILVNAVGIATQFCDSKDVVANSKQVDAQEIITRKLHWHAHGVKDIVQGSTADVVFSGGIESVLVHWQLDQGTDKPADMLPRIALDGIVHLNYWGDSILVYCADNSLTLFKAHSKAQVWRVQGLNTSVSGQDEDSVPLMFTDRKELVVTSGPNLHWYDPLQQRVTSQLQVAPFNRISQMSRRGAPVPVPVIRHAKARAGSLVTVDVVPTENTAVGATKDDYGAVTTIRFWRFSEKKSEYEQLAAMTHPHGIRNKVAVLSLSDDALSAVTVSNEEGAFRLWQRRNFAKSVDSNEQENNWYCRCKIEFPSGYANHEVTSASFSPDKTVLAVVFGNTATMWDLDEVALLNCIRLDSAILSVRFVRSPRVPDFLLLQTQNTVSMQSPYGGAALWCCRVPAQQGNSLTAVVACMQFVQSSEVVAICTFEASTQRSRVTFVDALSGDVAIGTSSVLRGRVQALASIHDRHSEESANQWGSKSKHSSVSLYALGADGELAHIHSGQLAKKVFAPVESSSTLPTLPKISATVKKRKLVEALEDDTFTLEHFVNDEPTSKLPLLRGAFSSAFLSRQLHRVNGS